MHILTKPFDGRGGMPRSPFALTRAFGMGDPNDKGLQDVLERLMLHAGMNTVIEVNDCETDADWTEVTSGFTQSVGTAGNKVGTNCLKLTSDGNATGVYKTTVINESAVITPNVPSGSGTPEMDWRDTDYLGFWVHSADGDHFGTNGELQVSIDNGGTIQTYADVKGTAGTAHRRVEIDMTSWSRDKVRALYFRDQNSNASENVYIDHIIRYKFGNGKGPVLGPCMAFPITSGSTLTKGNIVKVVASSTHRVQAATAAAVDCLGPCVIGGTGTAAGTVWATVQIGGLCYLEASDATVAGEGVEWASGHQIAGVSTGIEEKAFGRCFEAAGEQYDDILCQIAHPTAFIS